MTGYEAVRRLPTEAPELLPLVRACFAYPLEPFSRRWIDPRASGTLEQLVELGVLERVETGRADTNALYRFADREGADRALADLRATAQAPRISILSASRDAHVRGGVAGRDGSCPSEPS
jgi:hypothetical protein